MNKKLIGSLVGILLFSSITNTFILKTEASNISKIQEDLSPLITYITEKKGDREKMKVTVTVEDRSGTGIKEFRDHNNSLINSNTITVEFNRRINATFKAIDNNNNNSQVSIDLSWINPLTHSTGTPDKIKNGSTYWSSSNIREWLNSSEVNVHYTSNEPNSTNTNNNAYDNESGFLSQFTKEEIDAIARTNHRTYVNYDYDPLAREGGGGNPGHANIYNNVFLSSYYHQAFNYKNYGYKKEIDKVYLMSPYEVYWYLVRRDFSTSRTITPQAKRKHNINSNTTSWYLLGGTSRGHNEKNYCANTNKMVTETNALTKNGIVPMINLMPDFILSNNKKASELKIGDVVVFGKYLDAPIEWQVVNITNDNCPTLLSNNILDLKIFDAKGDYSRIYSDYVEFDEYDNNTFEDVQYKNKNGLNDINPPTTIILNEDDLNIRQSSEFTLKIKIVDDESGIDYIIKPNGEKSDIDEFNYTFTENGDYIIKTMDKAGNYNEFLIPICNINQKSKINIASSSSTEWSKEDVYIDIDSSNSVKQYVNKSVSNGNGYSGSVFPNYASYVGKKFKISGQLRIASYKESVLSRNGSLGIGFSYNTKGKNEYTYTIGGSWPKAGYVSVNEIIEKEIVPFEFEYIIPTNYTKNLQPFGEYNIDGYNGEEVRIELVNVKYEIIDESDFAISSIILPDGTIREGGSYRDIISKDGVHNLIYSATDNRGDSVSKTIIVKIDKTAPTLNLNCDTNVTNKNIVVNIISSDTTSGIKRIKLPNGNYITNLNSTYTISGDGEYTFECEDVAGNITTKTISINNIDKEKPNVTVNKSNTDWTNKGVQININAVD